MTKDEEIVMYIVVNKDLKMGKGKTSAQVAHSACKASYSASKKSNLDTYKEYWHNWFCGSYTKIVVKATQGEMQEIINDERVHREDDLRVYTTYDEGRTQIKGGSLTSLAFIPMPKNKAPEKVRKLKLL